jgi:cytochrome P450
MAARRSHQQADPGGRDGRRTLSEEELLATVGLLIIGGHETTSNLIGIGMLMLLDHGACDRQSVAVT